MRRSYKFRIYPTAGQARPAAQCLRDHQRLCNAALEERREAWRMRKAGIRYGQQSAQLKDIRAVDQDQGRWSFSSQQATLRRLDKAMAAFYRRCKAGEKRAGYPRFKALDRWDCVEWPSDGDGCRWKPEAGRVKLQGIGHVKVHAHRAVRGRVKTISLKREGRRWYVVLSCDGVPAGPLPATGREIGIDAGVARFATTSDGEVIANPRFARESADELAAAQQALARKKRGSANRRRARAKVAEVHRRTRNRRSDFHHKTARTLVSACDVIALEDLRVINMTRSASGTPEQPGTSVAAKSGLNKSILDAVVSISTGGVNVSELWRKGAVELAAMIRDREVTSREVVQAHLDRIEAVNPALNAIVRLLPDEALAAADAADRAVADGAALGSLHGVPCTVKENIDLAGTPTTQAIPALAEAIASDDAPQVERLRAAGAIPLGRTNLPDFGLRVHTDSSLHGLTRNPWNPQRTAGGSSGGEAAALATGMSPLGLGNDLGGSLRNPAHCCGIASIKPSAGAVPAATVIPPQEMNISFQLMAVEGVLARRVADVRAGFTAIAGQHPRDPLSVPAVFTDLEPGERPAVAVLPKPPGGSTHPEVAAAVRRAADALADDGYKVTEAEPPGYEQAIELWGTILSVDLRVMKPVLDQLMGEGGREFLRYALGHLPAADLEGWATAHTARHGLARHWNLWYQQYPVLLCPVWTQPAFPLDFDIASLDGAIATLELMRPVLPANLLGTPAAVVPAGMADGLPVGVQVMGARYTDLRCLAVAEAIEQRLGPITPIDPVTG